MFVRTLVVTAFLAVAGSVMAQATPEQTLPISFKQLRQSSTLRLTLTGTETTGNKVVQLWAQANYQIGFNQNNVEVRQVEIVEYRDQALVQRVVADGQNLYAFDPTKKEYLVTAYAGPTKIGGDMPARLAAGLSKLATGQGSQLARLLSDMYGVNGSIFRTWTPGFPGQWLTNGIYNDPIVQGKTYVCNPAQYYAYFAAENPSRKTMGFRYDSQGSLMDVTFAEYAALGAKARIVDWTASIQTGLNFQSNLFLFVPPQGSRPVTGPHLGN